MMVILEIKTFQPLELFWVLSQFAGWLESYPQPGWVQGIAHKLLGDINFVAVGELLIDDAQRYLEERGPGERVPEFIQSLARGHRNDPTTWSALVGYSRSVLVEGLKEFSGDDRYIGLSEK